MTPREALCLHLGCARACVRVRVFADVDEQSPGGEVWQNI